MVFLFPLILMVSFLDPAPTAASQGSHWLDCSTIESEHGRVDIDYLTFVFFDTDSSVIDGQGAERLDSFVSNYSAPPHCHVLVEGHADRAGSAHYNLLLSRRRADAVAAYLRRKGLTAPLAINSYGESRPLVETADGVAEPQNRYVAVVVVDPPSSVR